MVTSDDVVDDDGDDGDDGDDDDDDYVAVETEASWSPDGDSGTSSATPRCIRF